MTRLTKILGPRFAPAMLMTVVAAGSPRAEGLSAVEIGNRRELFVDRALIEKMDGVHLTLHRPQDEGAVMEFNSPWEGRFSGYLTVIRDDEIYRLYYRGKPTASQDGGLNEVTCYAESPDGIHWSKPRLGLVEIQGRRDNNVILGSKEAPAPHNFTPFLDTRPGVSRSERYKALGGLFDMKDHLSSGGLIAYVSEDGIRWSRWRPEPVIGQSHRRSRYVDTTPSPAFWSESEGRYVCYLREWIGERTREGWPGTVRWIGRATSPDFADWTSVEPVHMEPVEHIYTNQLHPYFRAPHLYVGVAARFMPGRRVLTAEEAERIQVHPSYFNDCSDAVLLTSRGKGVIDRVFREAFIPPGIGPQNWVSRSNYPALNIVQTGPSEMSVYLNQNYGQPTSHVRRYSLRLDGFSSVRAPYDGGELLTRPLLFSGRRLLLNYATSAAGGIRVEIQGSQNRPLPGYALEDSRELIGNEIERVVSWAAKQDIEAPLGEPVRLRFVMQDADLFSFRFAD